MHLRKIRQTLTIAAFSAVFLAMPLNAGAQEQTTEIPVIPVEAVEAAAEAVDTEETLITVPETETVTEETIVTVPEAEAVTEEKIVIVPETETVTEAPAYANTTLDLDADATYSAASLVGYGRINLNGHTMTVNGDFSTSADIYLGTNGTLIVNGNMTTEGYLNPEGGFLTVNGNYTQTKERLSAWKVARIHITGNVSFQGNGFISMNSDQAKITVGGNVSYNSLAESSTNSGVWTVSGNITQGSDTGYFRAGNLILNGTSAQTITLRKNSGVHDLTVSNSNVTVTEYLNGASFQSDFSPSVVAATLKTSGLEINGYAVSFPCALEATGVVSIGENGSLTVNGSMTSDSEVRCEKGTLTVKGDYTQTADLLYLRFTGKVNVSGDVTFTKSGYFSAPWTGGSVTVGGYITYNSISKTETNQAVWIVSGNILQEADAAYYNAGSLVLNGTSAQTITFHANSKVADVTPTNKKITITEYLNGASLKGNFSPTVTASTLKAAGLNTNNYAVTIPCALEATGEVSIGENGSLTVNGNMTSDSEVRCEKGTLTVKGDYTQTADLLYLRFTGKVNVSGDVTFTKSGYFSAPWTGGSVTVGGNISYSSQNSTSTNRAVWTVSGNITQTADAGSYNAGDVTLPKAGSKVTLPNGKIGTLTLNHPKAKYTFNPNPCWEELILASVSTAGWKQSKGGWWYDNGDGTYPKNQWKLIKGKWYLFNRSGYMRTGWVQQNGKWYYLAGNGSMATGWTKVGGKWYYMNRNGHMTTGWQKVGGKWYYMNGSGVMLTGWQKLGNTWYFFDNNGRMHTGWLKSGSKWYYFKSGGTMAAKETLTIGGTRYTFNASGVLVR